MTEKRHLQAKIFKHQAKILKHQAYFNFSFSINITPISMRFNPIKLMFYGEFEYDKIKFFWNQDNHSFLNWNRIFNRQIFLRQNLVLKSDSKTEFEGDSENNKIKFIWNHYNNSFLNWNRIFDGKNV